MSQSHIRSILPQKGGVAPVDNNTTFLAKYDDSVKDNLKGLSPIGNKYALKISNDSDYVDVGNDPAINPSSAITVECWFNPIQTPASGYRPHIVGSGAKYYMIGETTGKAKFYIYTTGWVAAEGTTILQGGTWYHLMGTYDGANIKIYVNGVLENTVAASGSLNQTTNHTYIGWGYNGSSSPSGGVNSSQVAKGGISEVRIWNAAKSQTESHIVGDELNLVGYWKLHEGEGSIAYDYSTIGNDGMIYGAGWSEGQSIYTLRKQEGYHEGGIAIEEATTNLLSNPDTPSEQDVFVTPNKPYTYSHYGDGEAKVKGGVYRPKTALVLNGSGQYVEASNSSVYDITNVTLEIDCIPDKKGANYQIPIGKSSHWFLSFHTNGNMYFGCFFSDSTAYYLNCGTYEAGKRYHFAGVYDGTTMRSYINGTTGPTSAQSKTLRTGQNTTLRLGQWGSSDAFSGKIIEARIWNTVRSPADIQSNIGKELKGVESGLIGYWTFNEGSGDNVHDKSPSKNHGSSVGSPKWVEVWGEEREVDVLSFDGVDDKATISSTLSNTPRKQITVCAWVYPTQSATTNTSRTRGCAVGGYRSMYLGIIDNADTNSSAMHWALPTASGRPHSWTGTVPTSQWSYLVGTYDGTTSRAYLNGKEIWSSAQSGDISNTSDFWIGTYDNSSDGNHPFPGKISEVRIYDRALSQKEIQKYMYKTLTGKEEGLVGYWPLSEGTGTTAVDLTPNNNHGAITGATWSSGSLLKDELSTNEVLRLDSSYTTGTATDKWVYVEFSTKSYTVATGDYLVYDVYCPTSNTGFKFGMDLGFSDGTRLVGSDQNSLSYQADIKQYAYGRWYTRKVPMGAHAAKVVSSWRVLDESEGTDSQIGLYRKIKVEDSNGVTKLDIYDGGLPDVSVVRLSNEKTGSVSRGYDLSGEIVEGVKWKDATSTITIRESTVEKTSGVGGWDAQAVSTQEIYSGDAWVEAQTITGTHEMIGFNRVSETGASYSEIDFAAYSDNTRFMVYENGSAIFTGPAIATGDRMRVSIESGKVKYYLNDVLQYTSATAPTYPLRVDSSFYNVGGKWLNALLGRKQESEVLDLSSIDINKKVAGIEFDKSNDYVETGLTASNLGIGGNNPKTVEAWVCAHSFNNGGVFEIGTQALGEEFSLRTTATNDVWLAQFWSTPDFGVTIPNSTNRWIHLALVSDGSTQFLYADGVLVGSEAYTLNVTDTKTFRIGRWASYYFDGIIRDIRIWNKALTANEIKANMNKQLKGTENGLVGYWPLTSMSGTTTPDKSRGGNDGTVNGGATTVYDLEDNIIDWEEETGIEFDGVDDYLLLGSTIGIGNIDWTASAWIKTTSNGSILSNSSGGPVTNDLRVGSSKICYAHYDGVWKYEYGTSNIVDGKWHYLTWVNSSAQTIDLYVDGVKEASGLPSTVTNEGPVNQIGRNWSASFKGLIKSVEVWNTRLTEEQIKENMKKELLGNESNLTGYWRLGRGVGTTVVDDSPNTNNGTIGGGARRISLNIEESVDGGNTWRESRKGQKVKGLVGSSKLRTRSTLSTNNGLITPILKDLHVSPVLLAELGNQSSITLDGKYGSYLILPSNLDKYQLEQKDFATSFIDGKRSDGYFAYKNIVSNYPVTVSAWFKINKWDTRSSNAYQLVVFNMAYHLGVNRDTKKFGFWSSSPIGGWHDTTTNIELGEWYMGTATYDGANLKVYVNGELEKTVAVTGNMPVSPYMSIGMALGGDGSLNEQAGRRINGVIDQLRIDKVARTEAEIMSWYYQGRMARE